MLRVSCLVALATFVAVPAFAQNISARPGETVVVEQLIAWSPDCRAASRPEVRIYNPARGRVSVKVGRSVIPNIRQAGSCAGRTVDAYHVLYTAPGNYQGRVNLSFDVRPTHMNAGAQRMSRSINIR
jgi:hypothetical protein